MSYHFEDGEDIIRVVRHSIFSYFLTLLVIGACIFVPLFFILPLFGLGAFGVSVFVIIIVLGLLLTLHVMWQVSRNYLLITNQHIIDVDKRRVGHSKLEKHALSKLKGIKSLQATFRERLFGYGDVAFKMDEVEGVLVLRKVRDPKGVKDVISNAVESYWASKTTAPARTHDEKHVDELRKLRLQVGAERFRELISQIEQEE